MNIIVALEGIMTSLVSVFGNKRGRKFFNFSPMVSLMRRVDCMPVAISFAV